MVLGSIGGMASTYFSYGELTVDAHLIVGLTMTAIIAISAALVPFMQKGNTVVGCQVGFGWEKPRCAGLLTQQNPSINS
jgi:hypothetical protein